MTVFNDGTGPALHVTGNFYNAGGVSSRGIAKWDGSNWSGFAGGVLAGNGRLWQRTWTPGTAASPSGELSPRSAASRTSNVAIWRP